MPRIASYVRLRGSEPNAGEEKVLGHYEDGVVHIAKQEEDGSDRHDASSLDQNYQKSFHEQQQKQLEDVNVSKGSPYDRSLSQRNLNAYHETSSPPRGTSRGIDYRKVDLKDDVREGRSGELKRVVSFRDGGNALKLGVSQSGKREGGLGEEQAQLERTMSGRWRPFGDEQFTRTTGSPLQEDSATATGPAAGQWAASIQRVASYKEILQQKKQQQQEQQQQKGCNGQEQYECPQGNHLPATICTMHSACNELRPASQRLTRQLTARLSGMERDNSSPARRARFAEDVTDNSSPPRRFQRQQTARFTEWEKSSRAFGEEDDEKPSPPGRIQRQQTARYTDWEKKAIGTESVEPRVLPPPPAVSSMVPRSSSEKIVHSQRSFSMRETSSAREEAESLSDQAPRRKSNATLVKPRVSFTDANSSRSDGEDIADSLRIHEKWKDNPSAMRQASFLNSTSQPLRYNYEQPGFVERRSTDGCGSYSTRGFRAYDRDHEKENARQPPLSRTISTFSFADKANYRRMARTFTFSSTKHAQPVVVECMICGKGLGIVIQGLPAGETSSFCKSCKPGLPGAVGGPGPMGTGEFYFADKSTSRTSSVKSYSKKKRSMLDYCRKLFGMSKRYHNK